MTSVRAALPHLVLLLADGYAGRLPVHDEAGDALVAGGPLLAREHGVEAGDAAVGDPALLSGDHIVVTHLLVVALHPCDVRAGIRLRAAIGGEDRLGEQPAQVLFLLSVGARDDDRHRAEHVGRQRRVDAGAAVGDLLQDQAVRQAGEAEAPD